MIIGKACGWAREPFVEVQYQDVDLLARFLGCEVKKARFYKEVRNDRTQVVLVSSTTLVLSQLEQYAHSED